VPSTEIQVMSVKNTARKTHTFTHHIILFKPRKRKKKATSRFADLEKFAVCNPCQSSPSFTILVPLWFKIMSLVFFYLSKILFSGFLKFTGNFVRGQNNSKYCCKSSDGFPSILRPFNLTNAAQTKVVLHPCVVHSDWCIARLVLLW